MIEPGLYIAFVVATVVLILAPGPAVSLIIANSLAYGTRRTLFSVAGISLATAGYLIVTFFSMASFLLLLAEWFDVLRWLGAVYLVYLGVRMWLKRPTALDAEATRVASPLRLFAQGFLVNATNPKLLIFYGAFFPQFVDATLPLRPQLAILCLTFFVIAATLDSCYATLGGRARRWFRSTTARHWIDRVSGTLLIGAGVGLALVRRG
jgi:threonine/homoserine/homoserine lactone efflux protein